MFSRDISVVMELRLRAVPPRNRISIPGNGPRFLSSVTLPNHFWGPPGAVPLCYKCLGHKFVHSPPLTAEVRKSWCCISAASVCRHVVSFKSTQQWYASCGPRPSPKWPVGPLVTHNIKTSNILILCLKALFVSSSSHSCPSGPLFKKNGCVPLLCDTKIIGPTSRKIRRGTCT